MVLFEEDMAIVCVEKLGQQSGAINVQRTEYTGLSFDLKQGASVSLGDCNGIFLFQISPDTMMDSNTTLEFSDPKTCLIALARISSSRSFGGEFQAQFNCDATPPSILLQQGASSLQVGGRLIGIDGFDLERVSISFNSSNERAAPRPPFSRCSEMNVFLGFSSSNAASDCQQYVLTQPNVISVACLIDGEFNGVYYVGIDIDGTSGWSLTLNMSGCHNITYVSAAPPSFYQRTFIWDFGNWQACRETLYTITAFDQYNNSTLELCTNQYATLSGSMLMEFNAANAVNMTSMASITTADQAPYFPIQSLTMTYPVAY